jgi:polysaccharide export outer membrane protein
VNVLQALATAGGLNPFAKKGRIKVFRHEGGKTTIYKFDYDDVTDGDRLEQNILLKRGDVIVVP